MKTRRQLAFLKVLAGLAWADGELSRSEVNRIKHFLRRFRIADEDWPEVEMVLAEPVSEKECLAHAREFIGLAAGGRDRELLAGALDELAAADGEVAGKERELIQLVLRELDGAASPRALLGGLRGLVGGFFSSGPGNPAEAEARNSFRRNRLLFRVRKRLKSENLLRPDAETLEQQVLEAGLLGLVLQEQDGEASAQRFRELLRELTGLEEKRLGLLAATVEDEARQGELDQPGLITLYRPGSSPEQAEHLVRTMFRLAADGGGVSHRLTEQIRRVAYGLGVSHERFVHARLSAKRQKS